jgi:hypothetical protein
MDTLRSLREQLATAFWYLRLVGLPVDVVKGIVYNTRNWHFVVDGDNLKPHKRYNKYRLTLHTTPAGRVERVSIG